MNITENTIHPIPTLKGENLYLRPARLSDYEAIRVYRQDVENGRYIGLPEDDKATKELVEKLTQPWTFKEGHWNGFVICQNSDEQLVGEIVFRIEDWQNERAEIGYRMNVQYAGKGYCTQAGKLLVDYLFDELGIFKLVAKCDPRNTASYKVMEKLGFIREAYFRNHYLIGDEWTDQFDYGLVHYERK